MLNKETYIISHPKKEEKNSLQITIGRRGRFCPNFSLGNKIRGVLCMNINHLILSLFFLATHFSVLAQNFEEDLQKVGETYQSGNYKIEVTYTFYGGHEGMVSLDQQTTSVVKKGNNFHTHQFGTEIITNKKYVLIIDHQNEIIAIEKTHKEATAKEKEKGKKAIEAMYQELYTTLGIDPEKAKVTEDDIKILYLGASKGMKGYRLSYTYGEYEHLDLCIDPQSNLLKEVWMYFRKPMEIEEGVYKKPKVKLVYGKQIINPVLDEREFSIDQYLDILANGEATIVHSKYKSFELINHLKQ